MSTDPPVLGLKARIVGWLCVVGMVLVIIEMLTNLPFMPENWWQAEDAVTLPPGHFDLRLMIICPGPIGWSGAWGYLAAWIWLPYALWRWVNAARAGVAVLPQERILIAIALLLVLGIQVLLRGTPLKYGYPLM
jgi:hypothetical protein